MKAEFAFGFFIQRLVSFIVPFYGWRTWWSPFTLRGISASTSLFEFGWWHLASQNLIFFFTALTLWVMRNNTVYLYDQASLFQHSLFHFLSYWLAAAAFLMVYSFRLTQTEDANQFSTAVRKKLREMLLRTGPLEEFDLMSGSSTPSGRVRILDLVDAFILFLILISQTRFKRGWVLVWLIASHSLGMYPLITWYFRPRVDIHNGAFFPASIVGSLDFLAHFCSALNVSYVLLITFECLTLFYYSRVRLMARLNRELADEPQLTAAFLKQVRIHQHIGFFC